MKTWCFAFLTFVCVQLSAVIPEKVIICTICCNASPLLPEMIAQLESIGSLFEDYRIVAYENNSTDDTPSQLYRWKRANPKVAVGAEFLSHSDFERVIVNCPDGQFSQTEKRTIARNKALAIARSQFGEEFSYILCVDADVKLESLEEIVSTFNERWHWDAVFAYGTDMAGNFCDWTAFRDALHPVGPELLGNAWYSEAKQFSLSKQDDWYPVYSAFGGFAIYKREALENCKYEALVSPAIDIVMREWLFLGLAQYNPSVIRYLQSLERITSLVQIDEPVLNLPHLPQDSCGIYISKEPFLVVWRGHGACDQYPEICEHLALHAHMYFQKHRRLFINPRLIARHLKTQLVP